MNLKQIADNDPGGAVDDAFNAMSSEMTHGNGQRLLTDQSIANDLGLIRGVAIMTAIEQAVSDGVLPSRIIRWIEGHGIDVNHADTQSTLESLEISEYITTDQRNAIIALGHEPKFPGLTLSDLQKARRLRIEGKI